MQAQMLERIATKLAEQKGCPEAKKESRKPRWGDFQKTNPPVFSGSDEPLDANDWLIDVERRLQTIGCEDQEKCAFCITPTAGICRSLVDKFL